jgi:Zinc carboxypeptidase
MPDPRYHRIDAILARFDGWAADHVRIFNREIIGETHGGEPIWAARISGGGNGDRARPSVLFHAAQHANEANGTNAILWMMERLLAGHGGDASITELVDGLDIWFVPIVNVDGHRRVFSGGPGWEEWRKNGRIPHGVDLNRNWDHRWDQDPSARPDSPNYKGPHPMSEPEVDALRDLILREMPVLVMDYHSPGKITAPNRIFWPWLERGTKTLGPDARAYRAIARDLAAHTQTETDGEFYDGDGYAYDTLPKEQCWVYRETGICILLMEISTRFWWEGPKVDEIAERVGRGSMRLLRRALTGPGLAVSVMEADTGRPLRASVRVDEFHDENIGPRLALRRHGTHWRFLPSGEEVTMTVSADEHASETRRVAIADSGWTIADFSLPVSSH